MRPFRQITACLVLAVLSAGPALAAASDGELIVECGGDFDAFLDRMRAAAVTRGADPAAARQFLAQARQDPRTLRMDRSQGVFQLPFLDFSQRLISASRLQNGQSNAQAHARTFDRIEREYGVPRGVLLAFWALETDYGAVQGDFNTLNSLATLSHDCRRPELFQPQLLAALQLYERGELNAAETTGAWAGEIGQVQMLPGDILANGVDADGDGRVSLKTSAEDALVSGAAMLRDLGWRPNEPWLQEVTLPANFDWAQTGLDITKPVAEWRSLGVTARGGDLGDPNLSTSVILPQGRGGPAFLAYPNFDVLFEWNQSFVYVATAAYLATRLEGAPRYRAGSPAQGLDEAQMKALQERLRARGHDVGGVDGILGAKTRSAVQAEQRRLGLPADAWPTPELLQRL